MKASEAIAKSELAKNKETNSIYQKVLKRIDEEAKKGERFAWLYIEPSEETKKVLVNDGYWFSEECFLRNEYFIKINW